MKAPISVIAIGTLLFSSIAYGEDLYRTKRIDSMGCNEKKITAEINFATRHPGALSDDSFYKVATKGQCSPVSPKALLKLIRRETYSAAGETQKVALVQLSAPGSAQEYFYLMDGDIEKAATRPLPKTDKSEMSKVFALTLIFQDGYLGGSSHMHDFKTLDLCNKNGAQMAMQHTSWGHPASFVCAKTETLKIRPKATVITHDWKSLSSGDESPPSKSEPKPESHDVQTLPPG